MAMTNDPDGSIMRSIAKAAADHYVTSTSTYDANSDILIRLRVIWQSEQTIDTEVGWLLCEAADEIEELRHRLNLANRSWWKRWLQP